MVDLPVPGSCRPGTSATWISPAMTRLAVARAIDRIDGVAGPRRAVVIRPHLVVRGTTGPPTG